MSIAAFNIALGFAPLVVIAQFDFPDPEPGPVSDLSTVLTLVGCVVAVVVAVVLVVLSGSDKKRLAELQRKPEVKRRQNDDQGAA